MRFLVFYSSLFRSAAWLAALAMALQALWPLIAQAKPRSSTLVPICTVDGVTHYFELRKGDTPLEKRTTAQHDHCAFCSLGGVAVLPSVPHAFHNDRFVGREAAQPLLQPLASRSFSSAHPRAPPLIS
jgi:hypothetical protein